MADIRTVRVNGIDLCVKEAGSGAGVVLIHGRNASKELMDPLFEHFEPRFHVASYDVRGHGLSGKPPAMTLDDCARDLAELVDALGMERPLAIGFSMGSYIALRCAEMFPEKLGRMALIGTRGERAARRNGVPQVFAPQTTPEQIAAFDVAIASEHALTREERSVIDGMLDTFDLLADAGKARIPALVMTGEYDGLNPVAEGRKVADALPNARFEVVHDAGHIAFFENPERVFELLDEFSGEGKRDKR